MGSTGIVYYFATIQSHNVLVDAIAVRYSVLGIDTILLY
jgi:hypothetical protein